MEKELVFLPYKMLQRGGSGEITEKKSRFIATLAPVESEEEAAAFIESVKKKYWDARHNCSAFVLGERAQITRGDTRRNSMVHGLDESFDGLILVGYHAKFGTQNAILDHTFNPATIRDLKVSGMSVGELGMNSYFAAEKGVPLLMVTGDQALEAEAKTFDPEVETVVVKYAEGRFCARCLPRTQTQKMLRDTAEKAVRAAKSRKLVAVPEKPEMEVTFQQVNLADGAMRVPGTKRIDSMTVGISAENMDELMALRQIVFGAGSDFYNSLF